MSLFSKLFGGGSPKVDEAEASTNEIPAVISQLQQSGKEGNFVIFMIDPAGALQYSIDGGVVGFDWVLIDPRNISDKAKIVELAATLGHRLEEREMNKVKCVAHYRRRLWKQRSGRSGRGHSLHDADHAWVLLPQRWIRRIRTMLP